MDMYEYYEKLTGGALSGYISELTLKGHSDNEIAMLLGVRLTYLFSGLGWFEWSQIIAEYRQEQKRQERAQAFPREFVKA